MDDVGRNVTKDFFLHNLSTLMFRPCFLVRMILSYSRQQKTSPKPWFFCVFEFHSRDPNIYGVSSKDDWKYSLWDVEYPLDLPPHPGCNRHHQVVDPRYPKSSSLFPPCHSTLGFRSFTMVLLGERFIIIIFKRGWLKVINYCWWKKSCTTW